LPDTHEQEVLVIDDATLFIGGTWSEPSSNGGAIQALTLQRAASRGISRPLERANFGTITERSAT
jgi:hypothetical protein